MGAVASAARAWGVGLLVSLPGTVAAAAERTTSGAAELPSGVSLEGRETLRRAGSAVRFSEDFRRPPPAERLKFFDLAVFQFHRG